MLENEVSRGILQHRLTPCLSGLLREKVPSAYANQAKKR